MRIQSPGMLAFQGLFLFVFCSLELKNGRDEGYEVTEIEIFLEFADKSYLFENCGARRADLRPYFLRSFIRGSRVKNPAALSVGRYSPST